MPYKDPEKQKSAIKKWNQLHLENMRKSQAKHKYGEGAYGHFLTQLKLQNNLCAICGKGFELEKEKHRDHNHNTKEWRGMLCRNCNFMLGFAKEKVEVLAKAIVYLQRWARS
jgi:DNA-directed RNA polymerase subunit RPC12/RpoP